MTMAQLYNKYLDVLEIRPVDAALWFYRESYISLHQCEAAIGEKTPQEQALLLCRIVSNVDGGQQALKKFAKEQHYNVAREQVQDRKLWKNFHGTLKRWTMERCKQSIGHIWEQTLDVLTLQEAYVHLTMLDVCTKTYTKVEPNDYSYLLDVETRIIIDSYPGMGKTTYVSKLAYDWATGKEPQLQYFDQIFLITLRRISSDDLDIAIANLIGLDHDLVRQCITSVNLLRKTLVILDGYDELHTDQFPKIIDAINGEKFIHVKMLVTTRCSHSEKIQNKPIWRRINGFKKKEQNIFLTTQLGASSSSVEQVVSLAPNFKRQFDVPLFLTIICAVVKSSETGSLKTKNSLSGPSALLNFMGAYHEILFRRATKLNRCKRIDDAPIFKRFQEAVGWHALNKVFPGKEWVSNLHYYYDIIINDLKFVNSDDVLTAAKEMCLVWHRHRKKQSRCTHKVDEFLFLHKIFEEYLSAVFLANAINQNEELLSIIPDLHATSHVSYFLSGMSKTYISSKLQQVFSTADCLLPWVADAELPALKDVAPAAACLTFSVVSIKGAEQCVHDMKKLTSHLASQLPGFLTQTSALLCRLELVNMKIGSDISPLFHSTIKELTLDNVRFTGEPFAALQNNLTKQANNEAAPVSGNETGVNGACKVKVEQLVLKRMKIALNMVCIFCATIKNLTFNKIKMSQGISKVLQKSLPANTDSEITFQDVDMVLIKLLCKMKIKKLNIHVSCPFDFSMAASFLRNCNDAVIRRQGNSTLISTANQKFYLNDRLILCLHGIELTSHLSSQLDNFVMHTSALIELKLSNIEISSDISFLFHSTINELTLDQIRFTGEPFATLQNSFSSPTNNEAALVSGNETGIYSVCKVNVEQLVLREIRIDFDISSIFNTSVKYLEFENIKMSQRISEVLQKSLPASTECKIDVWGANRVFVQMLCRMRVKQLGVHIDYASRYSVTTDLFSNCNEVVIEHCKDGTTVWNSKCQTPFLKNSLKVCAPYADDTWCHPLEEALSTTAAKRLVRYSLGRPVWTTGLPENSAERLLFRHSLTYLKHLELKNVIISVSRLAAFLVQCEEAGGIQCLSLQNILINADDTDKLNLTNGGNQLSKLCTLETLKLSSVSSACAHTLFELAVDCIRCLDVDFTCFKILQDVISRINRLDTLRICTGNNIDLTSFSFCSARLVVLDCSHRYKWSATASKVLKKTILLILGLRKFMGLEITAGRLAHDYIRDLLTIRLPHNYKGVAQLDAEIITFAFTNTCAIADMSSTHGQ